MVVAVAAVTFSFGALLAPTAFAEDQEKRASGQGQYEQGRHQRLHEERRDEKVIAGHSQLSLSGSPYQASPIGSSSGAPRTPLVTRLS
jgi:hypothetical protein